MRGREMSRPSHDRFSGSTAGKRRPAAESVNSPNEIARVNLGLRRAVDDWLWLAPGEARLYLEDPMYFLLLIQTSHLTRTTRADCSSVYGEVVSSPWLYWKDL